MTVSVRQARALVLACGVFLSLGGPIIRLVESATAWQFQCYRGLFVALALALALGLRGRGVLVATVRRAGLTAVVAGVCLSVAFAGYVWAVMTTTVANALFLLSAAPFLAALLGRWVLGETVSRVTWVAMALASTGVLIMVGGGVSAGTLLGNLAALAAAAGFAGFSVTLRWGRAVDMAPAVIAAGLISAVVTGGIALAVGEGLRIGVWDLGLAAFYGIVGIGVGLWLFTRGSPRLPAAELTLLSLTEVALGPVWVWLGFGEIPTGTTLAGGALVLGAVIYQACAGPARSG